jgi:signal transduction histidine kinase
MKLRALFGAVIAVAAATAGTFLIYDAIAPSISLLFFPAVVVPAIYGGYEAATLATVLSTISLAYFFVPPRDTFSIGIDDAIRLLAFLAVSFSTAWLSAARRRATNAERQSVEELRAAIETLRRVSAWPPIGGPDLDASIRQVLGHAANVLGAERALAVWETDDEPWLYVARSGAPPNAITKLSPESGRKVIDRALEGSTFVTADAQASTSVLVNRNGVQSEWRGTAGGEIFSTLDLRGSVVSAPFRVEHVTGRLFLAGIPDPGVKAIPPADVVAHEVAHSLEQLYIAQRTLDLAVREDRLRVSRDLHDGVLQALTGIRLNLQTIADDLGGDATAHPRLLAIERALAMEQRALRLFIDDLKPVAAPGGSHESIRARIENMCSQLAAEWRVPISVRVLPADLSLSDDLAEELRLMVHEAAVNALKHSHASRITVDIVHRDDNIRGIISDDGIGFPVRITALSGRLRIESKQSGSRVEFAFPVRPAHV